MRLAFRLIGRDLAGGWRRLLLVTACIALGVAALAGSGSLAESYRRSLQADASQLLGGDVELRLSYRGPTAEERALLASFGRLSEGAELRAMIESTTGALPVLAEVRAVDRAYPLFGRVGLDPPGPLGPLLAEQDGVWGAVADPSLLDRLGVAPGGELRLGQARLRIGARLVREPDRASSPFLLGPRLLVAEGALAASGLIQPGSLVRHRVLLGLAPGFSAPRVMALISERFLKAGWQIRDNAEPAPGLKRFLDGLAGFLGLVGLTTLLIGGIGVAGGVAAFVESRRETIATLKCLGAPTALILAILGGEIALMVLAGTLIGLAAGAALPGLVGALAPGLPLAAAGGPFPLPLARAGLAGGATAVAFSAWPLARAAAVPGAVLFRDLVAPAGVARGWRVGPVIGLAAALLAGLTVTTATDRRLAVFFLLGVAGSFLLFGLAAAAVPRLARLAAPRRLSLRLAFSNLSRPGAPTRPVLLSLGLGLTVLAALTLVEAALDRELGRALPARAPSFFFLDLQPDRLDAFRTAVAGGGGTDLALAPMIRGRISRIEGRPVESLTVGPDAQWALRGDRGLSAAARPPEGARIVAGTWWPADYRGPPLVSVDARLAEGLGLRLGGHVTLNVLGRELTAEVANFRQVDWTSLAMNFAFILTPEALAGAPLTYLGTARAPAGGETRLETAALQAAPGLSVVRVGDALAEALGIAHAALTAIRAAALVSLAAGLLVLAGAMAAGRQRRRREAVLLKILGAERKTLLAALLVETGLLGLAAGLPAALLGSLAARLVMVDLLKGEWVWSPWPLLSLLGAVLAGIALIGAAGDWRTLSERPASWLGKSQDPGSA